MSQAAAVAHAPLVGDPQDVHVGVADALRLAVESVGDQLEHVLRHALVDVRRELDEARLEPVLLRLPGEVERVDRDAVPAQPRPGIERHEAEGLGRRRVDHLPDVDLEVVAEERQLVHQADRREQAGGGSTESPRVRLWRFALTQQPGNNGSVRGKGRGAIVARAAALSALSCQVVLGVDDYGFEPVSEDTRRLGDAPTLIEWDNDIPTLATLVGEAERADGVRAHALEVHRATC